MLRRLRQISASLAVLALLSVALAVIPPGLLSPQPALAATKSLSGRIMDASYSSTAVITSDYLVSHGNVDRVTFAVLSTQAGTLQVKYRAFGGEEVNVSTSVTITANELEVVILNFALPNVFVTFTPDAATAGEIWIDGVYGTGPDRRGS
jgi:hypothetical protein